MQSEVTFVTHITLKNGRVIYARDYGKKAFAIPVHKDDDKRENDQQNSLN